MNELKLIDNDFLRQFECNVDSHMARIEYAKQERKIFLTKLHIPKEIDSESFQNQFIKTVLDFVKSEKIKVVPTSSKIASFIKKNKTYHELLPVGIKI